MIIKTTGITLILMVLGTNLKAQTTTDSLQVKEVVTKYVESFYLTQPKKGQESIHPLLAKRTIQKFEDGSEFLKGMTYEEMANLGKVFNARNQFDENSKKEISILDMLNQTVSVKLVAEGWVDYIHLGKINGEWKIINVLWQRI